MRLHYTLSSVGVLLALGGCISSVPDASGGQADEGTADAAYENDIVTSDNPVVDASVPPDATAQSSQVAGSASCVNVPVNSTSFISYGSISQAPGVPLPPGALAAPAPPGSQLSAPIIQPIVDKSTTLYTSYYALNCPASKIAREDFATKGADFVYHQYNFFNAAGQLVTNQAALSSEAVSGTGADTITAGIILGAVGGYRDSGKHYGVAFYQDGTPATHSYLNSEIVYTPDFAWQSFASGQRTTTAGPTKDGDYTITVFKTPSKSFNSSFVSLFGNPRGATKPTPATIGKFTIAPASASAAITFKFHLYQTYSGALPNQKAHIEFAPDASSARVYPQVPNVNYTFHADPVDESYTGFTRPDPAKGEVYPVHAWVEDSHGGHVADLYYNLYGNGYFTWEGENHTMFAWNWEGPDQLALEP